MSMILSIYLLKIVNSLKKSLNLNQLFVVDAIT
jgi:hypothetical protein